MIQYKFPLKAVKIQNSKKNKTFKCVNMITLLKFAMKYHVIKKISRRNSSE